MVRSGSPIGDPTQTAAPKSGCLVDVAFSHAGTPYWSAAEMGG
jgi:hypothetical protein